MSSDGRVVGSIRPAPNKGTYAHDGMDRTIAENPKTRRRCSCCGKRASHVGLANGVALMGGCEWAVRKWCQDPRSRYQKEAPDA